jgi:DNA-binding NarL/FixJ family response regulator
LPARAEVDLLTRVLLADDHQAMLDRVCEMLRPEFDVVGMVTDGQAVLDAAAKLDPDVLVMDISMPVLSGLEATYELKRTGCRAKIVFLTVHEESDFVRESLACGASAYVTKARLGTDLSLAIHEALAGRLFVSPPLSLDNAGRG